MSEAAKNKPTAYEQYLYRQACRICQDPMIADEYLPEEIIGQLLYMDCSAGNDAAFELVGLVKHTEWDRDVFTQAGKNILDKFKIN